MPDFPSLILKGLGIVLILLGLSGILTGLYAFTVVYEFDPASEDLTSSLLTTQENLETQRGKIDSSVDTTSSNLSASSTGLSAAQTSQSSAAGNLTSASTGLAASVEDIRSGSQSIDKAGDYLADASDSLKSWADAYSFNGSPLPSKTSFKNAVGKIDLAATQLKTSSDKLDASASDIETTAVDISVAATALSASSDGLGDASTGLGRAGDAHMAMKEPMGKVIDEMSGPIKDTTEGISDAMSSDGKIYVYMLVGYFTLIHMIILGLGIALVIIEINLFYPIA